MPQHFDAEGKKAWRWLVKTLRGMAILAASDVALMTLYCDSWSQYIAIRSELAAKGVSQFILHCKVKGTFYRNPLVDTEAMLKKQLMMCLTELGLSPISRARLQVRPQESNDPMAELLAVIHARRTHASKN
jgi:P27 family predicted phage terminase small subunit